MTVLLAGCHIFLYPLVLLSLLHQIYVQCWVVPRQMLIDRLQSLELSEHALNLIEVHFVPFAKALELETFFGSSDCSDPALTQLFQEAL